MRKKENKKNEERLAAFEILKKQQKEQGKKMITLIDKGVVMYGLLLAGALCTLLVGGYLLRYGTMNVFLDEEHVNQGAAIMGVVLLLGSVVIHEFFHGVGWAMSKKATWKNIHITFGGEMPLCHCDVPLPGRDYIIGVLLPLLVLGIIPGIMAFFISESWLILFSFFNVLLAGGDIWIAIRAVPYRNQEIIDHPVEPGFVVFVE